MKENKKFDLFIKLILFARLFVCFIFFKMMFLVVLASDEDQSSSGYKRAHSSAIAAEENSSKRHYAIATTDTAFKHMLSVEDGDKEIMRSFLQAFVPSFASDPIAFIESCPVAIPVLREKGEKQTFMDLHVRTQNGTRYIIEMQAKRHIMFDERALYYACATYANQLTSTQLQDEHWYHNLRPVIAIQVLDYDSNRAQGIKLPEGVKSDTLIERVKERPLAQDQYIKHYALSDRYSRQMIDYLQMIQVELPRAKPVLKKKRKDHAQFSDAEWWVELFCFSSEYTEGRILELKATGVIIPEFFEKALHRLDMNVWAPKMQREYEVDLTDRETYATVLAVERKEGREEGKIEERKAIALEMLNEGLSDEMILKLSKLTAEELAELKASI